MGKGKMEMDKERVHIIIYTLHTIGSICNIEKLPTPNHDEHIFFTHPAKPGT
jgi:hypothetical protein